ncbi:MAG: phenylalanine--tRNA ligase subunit beta [Candidatus Saccharibacteria bacterium]|nr:phenylalanine--tRNA ligase subunit beta [Candidatus Saccharibacteria bacterium]
MLVSLNEIKKLVQIPADITTDELVKLIGSRLVEVEGTIDWSERYENIFVVKVISAEDIEGTHLHLCQIDAGKSEPVQVVCGAPNVHAGMFAVWIAPGAIVPSTWDDEHFEITMRPLRGYDSYGMLAGPDELGFDTEHSKIAEIDPKLNIAPGTPLKEVFDLDDVILDIENKSLTHRPDTFGLIGFAREVAGILGIKFEEPEIFSSELDAKLKSLEKSSNDFSIEIADSELCARYTAAIFETKDALEAEKYLTADAIFLAKSGMRAISKIVDATNIVMLMTGQPLHAFDYDKFVAVGGGKNPKIGVRLAEDKETLKLLDGKTIDLNHDDIIITSNNIPVALAGAMGGESTEIDADTHRVILESATFSLYNERKTQMAHGIFSEAITRFTKGQPAVGTRPALAYCIEKLHGEVSSYEDDAPGFNTKPEKITLSLDDINSLLGSDYSASVVKSTLENVGFTVDGEFTVTAPLWRTDIHIKEDIIEEVGRLNGYDNITPTLPLKPMIGAERNQLFDLKREIRGVLSDELNAHETLTYSFVSKALQEKAGEDVEDSYEIVNSISPELQVFRQSITPSLLEKVHDNLKAGFSDFTLYEMNQTSQKSLGLENILTPEGADSHGTPAIENRLALVTTGDFYQAMAYFKNLVEALHIKQLFISYDHAGDNNVIKDVKGFQKPAYLEDSRYVAVFIRTEDNMQVVPLGYIGEIKRSVAKKFKLEDTVSVFEISLDSLTRANRSDKISLNFSKFPSTTRDVTIETEKPYYDIECAIKGILEEAPDLVYSLEPVSVYKAETNLKKANLSFRLTFANTKKTMTSEEISDIMSKVESIK